MERAGHVYLPGLQPRQTVPDASADLFAAHMIRSNVRAAALRVKQRRTSQTTPPPSCSIKSMESTRSCGSLSTHAARFGGSSSATIPASASCQVVVSSVVVVLCCFPPSVSLFTPPVDDIAIALVLCTGCREPGRRECGEASGSFRLFPERRPSLSAVDFNPDRDSSLSDWNAAGQVAIKAEKCRGLCGEGHDCKTSGKQWPVQRRVQEQMTPAENSARRWLGLRRYR
eukprot:81269-Rhodomonas_salina.1